MTIITEIYNLLFDFKNRKKNRFLRTIDQEFREKCINNLAHSKAQKIQDLFVLSELKFKENGFFVEFGATNGIELSNTFLLEHTESTQPTFHGLHHVKWQKKC